MDCHIIESGIAQGRQVIGRHVARSASELIDIGTDRMVGRFEIGLPPVTLERRYSCFIHTSQTEILPVSECSVVAAIDARYNCGDHLALLP